MEKLLEITLRYDCMTTIVIDWLSAAKFSGFFISFVTNRPMLCHSARTLQSLI